MEARTLLAAAIAALALAAAPAPAAGAGACRPDRLGNTLCPGVAAEGSRPPLVERPRLARPRPPAAPALVPAHRTDAFGTAWPAAQGAAHGRGFGEPPRPGATTRVCRRDGLGHVRCR